MTIRLLHAPRSRSTRFIFLLEELGAPYEIETVGIRRGDGSGAPDPRNPHPHGKVPAIVDGDAVVFESPAIALYLTDRFPAAGLGPTIDSPLRGSYLSWLAYYGDVMEPAWMSRFMQASVPRGTAGWVEVEEVLDFVDATLARGPFLLGDRFSAADILVGTTFAMFMGTPMLASTPARQAFVERVVGRPAFARAQALDSAPVGD